MRPPGRRLAFFSLFGGRLGKPCDRRIEAFDGVVHVLLKVYEVLVLRPEGGRHLLGAKTVPHQPADGSPALKPGVQALEVVKIEHGLFHGYPFGHVSMTASNASFASFSDSSACASNAASRAATNAGQSSAQQCR